MKTKLVIAPLLFAIACIIAGAYGALHNQISYSVSPEYFTKFKFPQFGLVHFQDRVGAAIVGWNAAWWMGLVSGIVLIPLGMQIPGARHFFCSMIRVFGIVAATALGIGGVAFLIACLIVDPNTVEELTRFENEIVDDAAFTRAGAMHHFSYFGGLVGIIFGGIAIFRIRRNQARAL
ncbi:MAG: hypothetical protein AAF591_23090 [Verrucomicrobiota bacterium]